MQLRPFGASGVAVTPLGLGLAALGRPGYINLNHSRDLGRDYAIAAMEAHAHRVLDAAWDAGIRYFDAARSYGRAEDFLGSWLTARAIDPAAVFIASKWGYTYTAGWHVEAEEHEVKEHTLPVLRRQWDETQARLGGSLRLYQIHSATFSSGVLANVAVLTELARRKEGGTLIGLSLSGPEQGATLLRALEVKIDGVALFDAVQATWNLLEPSVGPALADASRSGLGVVVKEALANGRLTSRNDKAEFSPRLGLLHREAERLNTTVDALALAAALAQPWADVVLSGAAQADHVTSNAAALEVAWDAAAAASLADLAEPPARYWQTRSNLAWN
ncbi:MAG: aldo/keto reductase [Caldilineaceae bacterium]|nr:aldo/keto reductase [Caldilineaceae bacterium]